MIKTIGEFLEFIGNVLSGADKASAQAFILDMSKEIALLREKVSKQAEQIVDLKMKITEYDRWDEQKKQYETFELSQFTFCYRLPDTGELFCKMCSEQKRMPIHLKRPFNGKTRFVECLNCKNQFNTTV